MGRPCRWTFGPAANRVGRTEAGPVTSPDSGGAMIQPHEPASLDLAIISLHSAIRRVATRILQAPEALGPTHFRRVERLMRIALDLAGVGSGLPHVEFHGIPPTAGAATVPE